MAIQYSDANNIIKMNLNKGENCNHVWIKNIISQLIQAIIDA